jgi:predicted nucleic acid-binding protein
MPKTVIVNSTPIIALSSIDSLHLLKEIYGTIIIPNAVKMEIEAKKKSKAQTQIEAFSEWIQIGTIKNTDQKRIFRTQLHDGEVEVIILGQELDADLLVIDDYVAREYAKYLGFNIVGTVGILLLAKTMGLIHQIKPLVDRMVANNIYVSDRLYSEIMQLAGE